MPVFRTDDKTPLPGLGGGRHCRGGIESRYLNDTRHDPRGSHVLTIFRIQDDARQAANTPSTGGTGEVSVNGNGRPEMTNRLRVLRRDQSWSQAKLARRLGVSRQTVNALERGKYHPSLPLAFKIAWLFERPIEEVFHPQWGNGDQGNKGGPSIRS